MNFGGTRCTNVVHLMLSHIYKSMEVGDASWFAWSFLNVILFILSFFMVFYIGFRGRGIWRCVYDHESATLVTAGADSAIKVQSLVRWNHEAEFGLPGETSNERSLPQSSTSNTEVFCISLKGPNVLGEGSSTSMDRY